MGFAGSFANGRYIGRRQFSEVHMKRVCILCDSSIEGVLYKVGQVVDLPDKLAAGLVDNGHADPSPASVNHRIDKLNVVPVVHGEPEETDEPAKKKTLHAKK